VSAEAVLRVDSLAGQQLLCRSRCVRQPGAEAADV
jgi:hypothetical protein